jgi:hypothetical protein
MMYNAQFIEKTQTLKQTCLLLFCVESEVEIFVTDYLLNTALWALNFENYLHIVITDGELPPNSYTS